MVRQHVAKFLTIPPCRTISFCIRCVNTAVVGNIVFDDIEQNRLPVLIDQDLAIAVVDIPLGGIVWRSSSCVPSARVRFTTHGSLINGEIENRINHLLK